MKKKLYSLLVLTSIFVLIINIFIKSNCLTNIIVFSTNLFIKNIFPSLFPMFIISAILVELDMPKALGSIFNKPMNFLFKTKGSSIFIFFMSMIAGFPSSAKYINDLIDKKIINEKDANKVLLFTFFSNPLFIINTVGNIFYNDISIGLKILFAHVIGNIIIGLIFRNYNKSDECIKDNKISALKGVYSKINNTSISSTIFKSISTSLEIMINLFGIITFFLIIINLIFDRPDNIVEIIMTGITEMTTGLKYLSLSNYSLNIKIVLSTSFISFGGLSVHFQIMNILNEKKVKYLPFLLARIMHSFISSLIIIIIL